MKTGCEPGIYISDKLLVPCNIISFALMMLSQKVFTTALVVIPVKTGIQEFQHITQNLDTRLRGYDDIMQIHH
jgi:hypothetical protein